MEQEQSVRALIAEQLGLEIGDINELPLVDVALALQDALGVTLPRPHLLRLGTYGDLLRLVSAALAARATAHSDELTACFVRARVVAGGADGRVAVVRVGWLTPDLAAAIADDVRSAPEGTWLDVLVPPDVGDVELGNVGRSLRILIDGRVRLDVRRIGEPQSEALRRIVTAGCGRLSHRNGSAEHHHASRQDATGGTGLADSFLHTRFTHPRRRSDQ